MSHPLEIRVRRLVDESLGGTQRAADVIAFGAVLVHGLAVTGILAVSWFDPSDLRVLLDARDHGALGADGTPPGSAVLVWLVAQAGSFPWWAAAVLLVVLTLALDLAVWWTVRDALGRRLRAPLALVVLGLPVVTAAATDLSTGTAAIPAAALLVVGLGALRRAAHGSRAFGAVAAVSVLAATAFHPGAGWIALVAAVALAATRQWLAAALLLPAVLATAAWTALAWSRPDDLFAGSLRTAATGVASVVGWPVWWATADEGRRVGTPAVVTAAVALVVALAVVGLLAMRRSVSGALAAGALVVAAAGLVLVRDDVSGTVGRAAPVAALVLAAVLVVLPRAKPIVLVIVVGVVTLTCGASAVTLAVVAGQDVGTRHYVRGVEGFARRGGTLTLADTTAPRSVLPESVGRATVGELFARSPGVDVLRSGEDLRVTDGLGFVRRPRLAASVGTPQPKAGTCGRLVRGSTRTGAVTLARIAATPVGREHWLAIDYLAAQDDAVTLVVDGTSRPLDVTRGAHTYYLRVGTEPVRSVALDVDTRSSALCVGAVRVGTLVASEVS